MEIHSTNPRERVSGEIGRRANVVGIFPYKAAAIRLIGALPLQPNDEGATQRARYTTLETIVLLNDTSRVGLPELASLVSRPMLLGTPVLDHAVGIDPIAAFS